MCLRFAEDPDRPAGIGSVVGQDLANWRSKRRRHLLNLCVAEPRTARVLPSSTRSLHANREACESRRPAEIELVKCCAGLTARGHYCEVSELRLVAGSRNPITKPFLDVPVAVWTPDTVPIAPAINEHDAFMPQCSHGDRFWIQTANDVFSGAGSGGGRLPKVVGRDD